MPTPSFLVDAFTSRPFGGNQAAVCLFQRKLSDEEYQRIAAEFNLSETAFPLPADDSSDFKSCSSYSLRWFTPLTEVPLCGHATLATAHVLFNELGNTNDLLTFASKSGELLVRKTSSGLQLNFPVFPISALSLKPFQSEFSGHFEQLIPAPEELAHVIKACVPDDLAIESLAYAAEARKVIVAIDRRTTKAAFESFSGDFSRMLSSHPSGSFVRGLIASFAPLDAVAQGFVDSEGSPFDYVSRYFAPWVGINEDPATGSSQCALAPFWSKILGKDEMRAFQAFPGRGAEFAVSLKEKPGRVCISGTAVTILRGEMNLE